MISSTQAAVDAGKNSLTSAGGIQTQDIQNTAAYSAKGSGFTLGYGNGKPSGSGGMGSDSGNASSTSQAGVSGIAGNTQTRTGDAETGLKPIFDKDKVKTEVQDQVAVTSAFNKEAAQAWGNYSTQQENQAAQNADKAQNSPNGTYEGKTQAEWEQAQSNWSEGGTYRVLGHGVIGGASGGSAGAAGAGFSQVVVPAVGNVVKEMDLPPEVKQAIVLTAGIASGGLAGGTTGAITGGNATVNNYLSHTQLETFGNRLKVCGSNSACRQQVMAEANQLSNQQQQGAYNCADVATCASHLGHAASAYADTVQSICAAGDAQCYGFVANQFQMRDTAVHNTQAQAINFGVIEDMVGAVRPSTSGSVPRPGANGGVATVITPEMETKILFGERVTNASGAPTNRLIGAHAGEISNSNPNYAVEVLSVNADGTRNAKLVTQFSDGNLSNIKSSTLFPESWTSNQTMSAVKQVGDLPPVATRADGATLYQSTVNGVKIEVIKVGNNVTAAYPCGRGCTSPTTFAGQ